MYVCVLRVINEFRETITGDSVKTFKCASYGRATKRNGYNSPWRYNSETRETSYGRC